MPTVPAEADLQASKTCTQVAGRRGLAGLHPGLLEPPTPGHQCHPCNTEAGWQARGRDRVPQNPGLLLRPANWGRREAGPGCRVLAPSEQEAAATAPGRGRGVGGHHAGLSRAPKACLAGRSWGLRSSSWGTWTDNPAILRGSPRRAPAGQGRAPRARQQEEVSLGRAFGTHPLADMLNTPKDQPGAGGQTQRQRYLRVKSKWKFFFLFRKPPGEKTRTRYYAHSPGQPGPAKARQAARPLAAQRALLWSAAQLALLTSQRAGSPGPRLPEDPARGWAQQGPLRPLTPRLAVHSAPRTQARLPPLTACPGRARCSPGRGAGCWQSSDSRSCSFS